MNLTNKSTTSLAQIMLIFFKITSCKIRFINLVINVFRKNYIIYYFNQFIQLILLNYYKVSDFATCCIISTVWFLLFSYKPLELR